jgi:hypothetical protein
MSLKHLASSLGLSLVVLDSAQSADNTPKIPTGDPDNAGQGLQSDASPAQSTRTFLH